VISTCSDTRVVIVGAGQTGMAVSHYLTTASIDHVLIERGCTVERWVPVVGASASGVQIADELAADGRQVLLAVGAGRPGSVAHARPGGTASRRPVGGADHRRPRR
jgi:cation diffusion facilitator CzcD-associated flavoprotein CzcO